MFEDQGDNHELNTAQICLNGHVTNAHFERHPEFNKSNCDRCGQRTITACPDCSGRIYGLPARMSAYLDPPSFCSHCGSPYPWTLAMKKAAQDYIDELLEIEPADREKLKGSLDDIASQTAGTEVALLRFKKAIPKLSPEGKAGLIKVLTSLAAEGVKAAVKAASSGA